MAICFNYGGSVQLHASPESVFPIKWGCSDGKHVIQSEGDKSITDKTPHAAIGCERLFNAFQSAEAHK